MNERLAELIDAYFHGSLDRADKRELAEALQAHPTARLAFADYARWSSGVGYALARLRQQEEENAPAKFPARSWKPIALAAAASMLLAFGVSFYLRTARAAVATLVEVSAAAGRAPTGDLTVEVVAGSGGRVRRMGKGAALAGGSIVAVPEGLRAQFLLPDGSTADLGGGASATFRSAADPAVLALARGALYGIVALRNPGEKPFVVDLPGGRSATALGTRFELVSDGRTDILRVEDGRVRLRTPAASRDAGPLQMLTVDPSGTVSLPEPVPLHAIAAWKFEPEAVPDESVLFQDDFERGIDRWEMPGQPADRMELAEGQGTAGGRCLVVHLCTANPYEVLTLYPKFPIRQRDFEFSFRYRVRKPIRAGPVFRVSGAPNGCELVQPTAPPGIYGSFVRDGWVEYRAAVRGTEVQESWRQDGRLVQEKSGRINTAFGYFTHVGFGAHRDETEEIDLYIDDVAIRKLAGEPSVPVGTVLFQEDFEKGMDRWTPLLPSTGRVEVVEGQGLAGSRCLLMRLRPKDPLVLFPAFEPGCRNFEVRYRSRIAGGGLDPKSRWTRDGLAFRVPGARLGALTARATTSMRYHPSPLSNGWVDHRFLVRGTEIYEIGIQDDRIKFDLSSRLSTQQGPYTQVGLSAYAETEDLDFYVDDFVIVKQADPVNGDGFGHGAFPVQAGAVLFSDDFSEGLDRWEPLKVHGGEMSLEEGRGPSGRPCLVFRLRPDERTIAFPKTGLACRNFDVTCRISVGPEPVFFGLAYRMPGHPEGYDCQRDTAPSKVYGSFAPGWADYRAEVRGGAVRQTWTQGGRLLKEKTGRIPTEHGPFTQVGLIGHTEGTSADFCIADVTIRKLGD